MSILKSVLTAANKIEQKYTNLVLMSTASRKPTFPGDLGTLGALATIAFNAFLLLSVLKDWFIAGSTPLLIVLSLLAAGGGAGLWIAAFASPRAKEHPWSVIRRLRMLYVNLLVFVAIVFAIVLGS